MTIYLCGNASGAEQLSFTLGEKITVHVNVRDVLKTVDADLAEQLVVIGPDLPMSAVRELTGNYRTSRPALGIILILSLIHI